MTNKKNKSNLKTIAAVAALFVIAFAASYLLMAFIFYDMDVGNWSELQRGMTVFISVSATTLILIIYDERKLYF